MGFFNMREWQGGIPTPIFTTCFSLFVYCENSDPPDPLDVILLALFPRILNTAAMRDDFL